MTRMYKLARPLMRGVVVEVRSNIPRMYGDDSPHPKVVKNRMVLDMLSDLPQFKGEVVVGPPINPECHETSQLFLENETFVHPFIFWVYDLKTTGIYDLQRRLTMAEQFVGTCGPVVQYVDHKLVESQKALDDYVAEVVEKNFFPGVVLREPFGTYGTEDQTLTQETGFKIN